VVVQQILQKMKLELKMIVVVKHLRKEVSVQRFSKFRKMYYLFKFSFENFAFQGIWHLK